MPKDKDISVIRTVRNKEKENENCDENCFQARNTVNVRSRSEQSCSTEIFNNNVGTKKGKSMN